MNNKQLTKCSFCRFATKRGCMVVPNSYYCKEAIAEFNQWLRQGKNFSMPIKSLKPWDKK